MMRGDLQYTMSCMHLFHKKCITSRLQTDNKCPSCQNEISNEDLADFMRRKNQKTQKEDRRRIVECANKGENWVALANTLDVKYKTAYAWIRSGEYETVGKGGKKPRILSDAMIQRTLEWLEEDCELTLKQLTAKICDTYNVTVCTSTLANVLEAKCFTTKRTHRIPSTMNTAENKVLRKQYLIKLNQFIREGKEIIWIDESNVNLFCRRTTGRARKGTRAVSTLPSSRGPNVHMLGAVSTEGVVKISTKRGSYRKEGVAEWLEDLNNELQNMGKNLSNIVIVCDNAPCHSRIESSLTTGMTVLRLGPYSPQLNPIEYVWSVIKSYIKEHLRIPPTTTFGVSLVEQRLRHLEELIQGGISSVQSYHCVRSYQHTTTYHAAVMNLEDLEVGM